MLHTVFENVFFSRLFDLFVPNFRLLSNDQPNRLFRTDRSLLELNFLVAAPPAKPIVFVASIIEICTFVVCIENIGIDARPDERVKITFENSFSRYFFPFSAGSIVFSDITTATAGPRASYKRRRKSKTEFKHVERYYRVDGFLLFNILFLRVGRIGILPIFFVEQRRGQKVLKKKATKTIISPRAVHLNTR